MGREGNTVNSNTLVISRAPILHVGKGGKTVNSNTLVIFAIESTNTILQAMFGELQTTTKKRCKSLEIIFFDKLMQVIKIDERL